MKITVSAQDLKETLSIAQNTLGTNQDITSHFIFTAEEAGVSVMACSPLVSFQRSLSSVLRFKIKGLFPSRVSV